MSDQKQQAIVRRVIARGSFCTIATSSSANRPHIAGVLYAEAAGHLYMSTFESSVKARNIRENGRVAVCVTARRYPFVPPFSLHFQGRAELIPGDDPRIAELVEAGKLKAITSHGELDLPGNCFIQVTPSRRVSTFGFGVPLRTLIRDPLGGGRSVEMV
ncbi:pyridoxamine 5'-phosphate oxidase family protein [Streptosporangium soli]|nr:pyridoxamine 5'-phosphate oxidase family protein [Streptosporangium sp. KLBMP 9127]